MHELPGLRKRARVEDKLEKLSVADALRAVRFAEVVVVLLDATIPFEKQDLQIADLIIREGRAPVIAVVGDKEAAAGAVAPRWRGVASQGAPSQSIEAFVAEVVERARVPISAPSAEPARAQVH